MKYQIYPSVTTTHKNWEEQISEAAKLKLKELGFFPTCLEKEERYLAYKLFKEADITQLPFVHIRHDMDSKEIGFLQKEFHTRVFNVHSQLKFKQLPKHLKGLLVNNLEKFRKQIYVETTLIPLTDKELGYYAGICLDTSHVENQHLYKTCLYKNFMEFLDKYPIGVAHISAVLTKPFLFPGGTYFLYDRHYYQKLSEFDYLLRYQKFLPAILALELENSIQEQIEAKNYLGKLLRIS